MNYEETAKQILEAVGGEENVSSLGNCMTRLRFVLKDESKVDAEAVHKIKAVKGVSRSAGQYQMIVGGEATDLCSAVNALGTFTPMSAELKKKVNVGDVILETLSGSLYPLVGIMVGGAMINIFTSIAGLCGADISVGLWAFFTQIAAVGSYFMPAFVGYSCAKQLGATPFYGMFVGLAMVYPSLTALIGTEGGFKMLGITVSTFSYANTVIPVILTCILLKYVEQLIRKFCPKVIAIFMVPALTLAIVLPITFLVVGPLGGVITNALSWLLTGLMTHAGFLAIAIFAALLPFIVLSGLHMGLIPLYFACTEAFGADIVFFPAFMAYNLATAGVALAVGLRSRDTEVRSLGISSAISSACGVTEPSLFGCCFRYKKMLPALMGGAAIGGLVSYFMGYKVTAPVAQSIFSIPLAVGSGTGNVVACIVTFVASFAAGFLLAWFLAGDDICGTAKKKETV